MLKDTVKYKDFNDEQNEEEVYFNLTREEMTDILPMLARLRNWREVASGNKRTLNEAEISDMYGIVKDLMKRAYGQRSGDGRMFRKDAQMLQDFIDCGAFDAYLFNLFDKGGEAVSNFLAAVMPAGLAEQAEQLVAEGKMTPNGDVIRREPEVPMTKPDETFDPTKNYTGLEFSKLTDEQKNAVFAHKMSNA